MTYEELIVGISKLAKRLPPAGLRLLIHLIATSIADGSNEVRVSSYDLAAELGISRDTVRSAALSLTDVLVVTSANGVGYHFIMPDGWFVESRGLFTADATVDNCPNPPGNQAATSLETRRLPGDIPGGSTDDVRLMFGQPAWKSGGYPPGNQAGLPPTRLESRRLSTQNQQLTRTAPSRSKSVSVVYSSIQVDKIYQIATCGKIPDELVHASSVICDHMRAYAQDCGSPHLAAVTPNELLMARIVAIAPLGDLISLLRQLRADETRCGDTYAWFVTTFAHRIHGIRSADLTAAFARYKGERLPTPQQPLQFAEEFANEVLANARRMA